MPNDLAANLVAPARSENARPKSFCRSFIQFLFSNLGLVILVVGYCVGGAFLFQLLEQYIELQNCQQGSCKYLFFLYEILLIHIFYYLK
jgi:hypothetical protein